MQPFAMAIVVLDQKGQGVLVVARLRPYASAAVVTFLLFYFAVNLLAGERGLLAHAQRDSALAQREQRLKALKVEHAALETEVRLLSDDHLSRDLLEQRSREILGYADPRDYIVTLRR
jgi:cell division protein FtsB